MSQLEWTRPNTDSSKRHRSSKHDPFRSANHGLAHATVKRTPTTTHHTNQRRKALPPRVQEQPKPKQITHLRRWFCSLAPLKFPYLYREVLHPHRRKRWSEGHLQSKVGPRVAQPRLWHRTAPHRAATTKRHMVQLKSDFRVTKTRVFVVPNSTRCSCACKPPERPHLHQRGLVYAARASFTT